MDISLLRARPTCGSRFRLAFISICILACSHAAHSEVIPLDISAAYNYDAFISNAEAQHAEQFAPPEAWGFVSQEVGRAFGDHLADA